MSNRQHPIASKSSDDFFRLKPLAAGVRIVIAGGLFVGSGVAPVNAEVPSPLPVPTGIVQLPTEVVVPPILTPTAHNIIPLDQTANGQATATINGQAMTINQITDKATIDWKSFNVDKGYSVNFVQPSSSSVALNNIHQADPSVILGTVTANGQIYLVNQNGFIFGNGSVVDANSLVASALNISDAAFNNGIIRVFDNNGSAQNFQDRAALNGNTNDSKTAVNPNAKIDVAAGAKIRSGKNGSIILAAPTVSNSGSISSDQQGQILLVASKDAVYLQPTSDKDPFAGLLVEVGKGGQVSNNATGEIATRQGNVTLAGFAVNQSGRISATTSVNVNGSVRLLARENAQVTVDRGTSYLTAAQTVRSSDLNDGLKTESAVTLGTNSSITVLADAEGGSAIDEQAQKQSVVEVSADKIDLQSGSSIVATGGLVNLTATNNLIDPLSGNKGRINLESGSRIDVSGSKNVQVAMERNVADVSIQSFNLRDAPYQRGGVLQGKTVKVDIRNLPTIADASSASASIKRGIDERMGNGGAINLTSSGDVVVNTGAVTDISGGLVNYQSGYINTTQMVNAVTGQVVDISVADPNVQYSGIYGVYTEAHTKWGVTDTYNLMTQLNAGRFENGYTDGKAGGAVIIQSPLTAWNGQLVAGAVTGINQRSNPVSGGSFIINNQDNDTSARAGTFLSSQNVSFQTTEPLLAIGLNDSFPKNANNKASDLVLSTAFVNQSGISNLSIKTAGKVTVENDAALSLPVLSQFSIDASSIDVMGSLYAAGGAINLKSTNTGATDTGQVNLFGSSKIDVSGRWINDFQNNTNSLTEPVVINAGTVSIKSDRVVNFERGAVVKADGGAWLGLTGTRLNAGKAGGINFVAGSSSTKGLMVLDGTFSAYGLNDGGSLSLTTNKINIGTQVNEANALNLGVTNGGLDITANTGINTVNLISNDQNIIVKANTDLSLVSQNKILTPNYRTQASSKSIADFSQAITLPENLRKPVTLGLTGRTGVTLETGSKIHVDKASTVNLSASNAGNGIYIDGLIDAPAGSINLSLITTEAGLSENDAQSIWLGTQAQLNTQGTTRLNPVDVFGRTGGNVLDGGNVTVKADRGYVVFEQGSTINVSGTSASLDLPVPVSTGSSGLYASQVLGSNAGKVNITAAEGIVLDGRLNALAGSTTNRGGSLSLTLDRTPRAEDAGNFFPNNALHIDVVQQATSLLPTGLHFGSVIPNSLNGQATVSSNEITQAGFDNLSLTVPYQIDPQTNAPRLAGEVRFMGDVALKTASSIILDAQTISSGVNGTSEGVATLDTAYLQIGSSTTADSIGASVKGNGKLTTHAMWTQLQGTSMLTGFNEVNLNSLHDMRAVGVRRLITDRTFTGKLSTAANLNLNASQIYPTTLTDFTLAVTDAASELTISGHNTDTSPLSAAGKLTLTAPVINQNGVLKAPLGTIALNAKNSLSFGKDSLTSVSADGQTIPFGVIVNDVWQFPLGGNNNLVFNQAPDNLTLGEKHLVFTSPDIQFTTGSIVDVAGGGNLMTATFQPGNGGSKDYLLPVSGLSPNQQSFAILPALGSSLAPFDPNLSANFAYDSRASVYLSGTATLPAGFYTILPSRYALLPGAYLVTPQAKTQDQIVTSYTTTGLPIVSGYQTVAGTNSRDSRLSGFLIESNADVKKHSQYDVQTASSFFTQQASLNNTTVPLLPVDSGQISIDASTRLVLDGQFKVATPNGRGAKMDISAKNIQIVNALGASTGALQILAQDLSQLHVDSLLLGGTRSFDNVTGNTQLKVSADNVIFDQGVQIQALDLVAVGKNSVELKNGASINSSGIVNTGDSVINVAGDSALIRVSADKQVTVSRSGSLGLTGDLLIDQGAVLKASQSLLLDASKSTVLNGDITMKGGALSMTANTINMGEVAGLTGNSLNLSNQSLLNLSVDDLVLNSRNAINFYGNVGQLDSSNKVVPALFKHLILDAAALSGFDNAGKTASLQASTLVLQNSKGVTAQQSGTGTGTLDLIATQFSQGSGNLGLNGFNTVNINADKQFTVTGNSVMNVASDLNLTAGSISTTGGHSWSVDATYGNGHNVVISGNADTTQATSPEFGGSIAVAANTITLQDANVLLPSGSLKLQAESGDVLVNGKTNINLAGQAVNFADTFNYTPGGTFSAAATNGKILLDTNSTLDISTGGGNAAGGSLILKAPEKTVELAGGIKAKGASATVDVSGFSATQGFDNLMNKLMAAGIADSLYFRSRIADITQAAGNIITATNLNLVADKGAIDISGTLNANGSKDGGVINLYAGDKITLESGALITAKGTDKGGKVLLSSVDSLAADHSGVEIKSGSTIDVSGASTDTGGLVTLSAMRTSNGINIKPVAGTVNGFSQFYAQGTQKYNTVNIDQINQDTVDYMAVASDNVANLGKGIVLRPGVEVDYNGDLTLASSWDFSSQRFGKNLDIPGTLVITASGKLNLENSITDGFQGAQLQRGNSWTFQLVSGADQTSADKFVVTDLTRAEKSANPTAKDLTIGSGVSIHTGSGDIKLASGGNIVFTDQTATVYNAGRADPSNPYGTMDGISLVTTSDGLSPNYLTEEYPIAGGDIVVRAVADIKGAISDQFITPWLVRQGKPYNLNDFDYSLTAWAIKASNFQQNIGSFGGGKVDIATAGNINDLSVMMPTTGKQLGTDFTNSKLDIQGGGQMHIAAGGNIAGGAYFLGKGVGSITSGGEIKGSNSTDVNAFVAGPQLVMSGNQSDSVGGNTLLTLNASQGIKISGVSDAMVLNHNGTQFFTYTDKSILALNSLAGDVHLNSDIGVISSILGIDTSVDSKEKYLAHVYPASLDVTAFNGSVKLDSDIILFPSAVSNLNVLAKQAITSSIGQYSLIMSDADPLLLPTALTPIGDNTSPLQTSAGNTFDTIAINTGINVSPAIHANIPLHSADKQSARLVTQVGDIASVQINLPKQAIIQAGNDLKNSPIQIQQINATDASIISAGRDIIFQRDLDSNGIATLKNASYKIEIGGPGNTLVKTGRNLNLGSSIGLSTVGNLYNTNLASGGSSLDVLVGLNAGTPDYSAFIAKYLVDNSLYTSEFNQVKTLITGFMRQNTGNALMSEVDAMTAFGTMTPDKTLPIQPQLNAVLTHVFFNELKIAGSASAGNKSAGNKGGFAAIDTLFPGNQWKGDLSLFFSKLQTVSGGDINLMVPGGQVNAGVAVVSAGAKSADQLGIVAQAQGNINAFVKNDFTVNTSRVFTLGGGDILIWSSEGNIDAGKGAKSALSVKVVPPFFDSSGVLQVPAPKITSGSGIRTASSPGVPAGDVFLFAPKGVVDAGEAGIGGTNVTISATAVLGANNIQVGGVSTGVPAASTGSLAAGLTGTSNMTANVSQVAQAVTGVDEKGAQNNKNAALGMFTVEVLGFGD